MGTSTDATLFYGVPEEEDAETLVAQLYGWDGENPKYAFEWEKQNPSPITVGMHCSIDSPMYYIAIKASERTANRGYPQKVSTYIEPSWDAAMTLLDFIRRLYERYQIDPLEGLLAQEKFGWYIVSYWG